MNPPYNKLIVDIKFNNKCFLRVLPTYTSILAPRTSRQLYNLWKPAQTRQCLSNAGHPHHLHTYTPLHLVISKRYTQKC